MFVGGYNSIRPEKIHPTETNSNKAKALLIRARRQYAAILGRDQQIAVDLVAHMVAMAEATLLDAPDKITCAIEEDGHEEKCYLLLAQQLKGAVTCDLYFPEPETSLSMIKAFTGIELGRDEIY